MKESWCSEMRKNRPLPRWLKAALLILLALFFCAGGPLFADDAPTLEKVASAASDNSTSINIMWTIIAGFLVFFMQAGFALVETGFTRTKNAAHTMMMNMMVFCVGAIGYWLVGFAFQFGGVNEAYAGLSNAWAVSGDWAHSPTTLGDWGHLLSSSFRIGQWGFLGGSGFMLIGVGGSTGVLAFFLFQMVFMDTAATIPTGSMAERFKFSGFVLMGFWVSMIIYPLVGGWIWGGGWLQNIGRFAGFGNGAVDFAGSGVVHMIGGSIALAGCLVIGPRIGRFNKDGSSNALPGHNIPLGILGTIILFFGWFGFNPGSALAFTGGGAFLASNAAVNTLIAGAVGGCAAMFYMWWFGPSKKPDPSMSVNGILAGLVAITAPCAFVNSIGATIIGLVAGVWVCIASFILEKLHIDDPVGAIPVHFCNGLWGVISVGLFACGVPASDGWNGVKGTVRGLFYGNGSQLIAQLCEVAAILIFVFGLSLIFFKVLNALKLLRSKPEDELMGLDIPEMGALGYSTIDVKMPSGGRLIPQNPKVK